MGLRTVDTTAFSGYTFSINEFLYAHVDDSITVIPKDYTLVTGGWYHTLDELIEDYQR